MTMRSLKILLVEDHTDTSTVLSKVLARQGHAVEIATDCASARRCAGTQMFDLLITDVGLPDGSGLDLMREMRSRGEVRGIVLSGYGTELDKERSQTAGFAVHLTKPVPLDKLLETIGHVMSNDATGGAPSGGASSDGDGRA